MDFSKVNKSFWSWRADNWETLIVQASVMLVLIVLFGWSTPIALIIGMSYFIISLPVSIFLIKQRMRDEENND